jgi:hypothetical protein
VISSGIRLTQHETRTPKVLKCLVPAGSRAGLRMTPAMVSGFGFRSAWRVRAWLSEWSRYDPKEPIPISDQSALTQRLQSRRIGQQLMEQYCQELDRTGRAGYLETDRPENVLFHSRLAFEIEQEIPVLGVRNYLMWRKAQASG